ncbi:hypothetical protein C7974DRAFT_315408 [Boeremia exigua]|uniref:uncharacterized protein n=1 Tax=Boeremia exigua TaxID=749465 RepID=UPI001E8D2EE5|nr:uncharacterized protein C7974DRAFT_315408 [Boeremia exigua]KAH6621800.1 hypothetical protein C7974DRAFT_315408 [Boeremia exigua]
MRDEIPPQFPDGPPTLDLTKRRSPVLTLTERAHLERLLAHKIRSIPPGHLPNLSLDDIIDRTEKINLANVPQDIGLAFLLRYREALDSVVLAKQDWEDNSEGNYGDANEQTGTTSLNLVRATWFYRLDPVRQFQRYHDTARWNIALYTALLTHHALASIPTNSDTSRSPAHRRRVEAGAPRVDLSPAAVRFITAYLAAVFEHHTSSSSSQSSSSSSREAFIRLHASSPLDLFTPHRSWAKKTLQREMKWLRVAWEDEISRAGARLSRAAFEGGIGLLVGSLVPGPGGAGAGAGGGLGRDADVDVGGGGENELLEALRVRYDGESRGGKRGEEGVMVCDLRMAVACVQSVRPRDMLPVLVRTFLPKDGER